MDKEFHTGMILTDLEKALDALDHTVLLQKMECMGLSVIKWLRPNQIPQAESFWWH